MYAHFSKALRIHLATLSVSSKLPVSERYETKRLYMQLLMLEDMRSTNIIAPGIYECSAMSRGATATDSRDRFYGLLGIIQFRVAEPIVPDYSKGWPQVLAEATTVMIAEDGLYPYMSDDFIFPSTECSDEGYPSPSWVLDFTRLGVHDTLDQPLRYPGQTLPLEAIEYRRKSLRLSEDFRTLYTHGCYIGTITAIATITRVNVHENLQEDDQDSAATLYDFYHDVLKPEGIAPSCLYNGLVTRLWCTQNLEYFTSSLLGPRHKFQFNFDYKGSYLHLKVKVFVTEKKDVGVTWLNNTFEIQADDLLVALFESQMPFILRPVQGHPTYRMVNLAYLPGRGDAFCERYHYAWRGRSDDNQHHWVDYAAEGCPEYAIV